MTLGTPTRTYRTEEAAHERVQHLVRTLGAWPAVLPSGDGTWVLSFDPADSKRDLVTV